MNFYQEITLLPDADIGVSFLWQKVYQQLHIALVEHKVAEHQSAIGVGFPDYGQKGFPFGKKVRLFAEVEQQLTTLNIAGYLSRLSDYTHIKSIQKVPENTVPVSFVRKNVKGENRIEKDQQSKAARWSVLSGKSIEVCLVDLAVTKPEGNSKAPFIWLESLHSKAKGNGIKKFPLFIERVEQPNPIAGRFTCYGLSSANFGIELATVPHF